MPYLLLFCIVSICILTAPVDCLADVKDYLDIFGLEMGQRQIAVKPDTGTFNDWGDVYNGYDFISPATPPRPINDNFFVLNVTGDSNIDYVIDQLNQDESFLFVNPVLVDSYGRSIYLTTRVYAEIKNEYYTQIIDLAEEYGCTVIDTLFASRNGLVLEIIPGSYYDPLSLGQSLLDDGIATIAVPDFIIPFKSLFEPNDIYYPNQYDLAAFDMPVVWEITIPPNPLLVAILDDGTEYHEDMDDSRWADGYDYINGHGDQSPPCSCTYCYHGMAVAGIIGATTNNDSMGVASIAGRDSIRILGQEIFNEFSQFDDVWASEYDICAAIQHSVYAGAAIINMSWGIWPTDQQGFLFHIINNGLAEANDSGVFVVCGSGNLCDTFPAACNSLAYPASYPTTFAVGALNQSDTVAEFSQGGDSLDVVGYGVGIHTLDRMNGGLNKSPGAPCTTDEYTCNFGGTSASAAQVSAITALVLQRRPDLQGKLDTLKLILRASCQNPYSSVEDTARIDNRVGWGRVNALRALLAVCRGDANNSGDINIADPTYVINYIFKDGPEPLPHILMGDADCSGYIDIGDAVYLINYTSRGGPPPDICFEY